jgi:type I restriction enzyme S subunit
MTCTGWDRVALRDFCKKIGSGSTPRGGDSVYVEAGTALIRSQNVYNGEFAYEGLAFLGDSEAEALRGVTVQSGDVLLNITGDSVARCCTAPENVLPARVNQHVAIIRPQPDELITRFLAYYLISPFMQETMLSMAGGGGTRKALTKDMIERFAVPKPPLDHQERIVAVLAAYDDLIDNNRRRIKLLEDSVRLLFDEWFVNAKASHWLTLTLQQLCVDEGGIQTGPFGSQLHQSDYSEEGVPVVMPKDLATMKIDTQTIARIPEHLADELGRHRMQRGDIVFGRRGEIGRRAYIGQRQVGYFCGTGCLRLRPDPARVHPRFLFEILRAPQVAGDIANRAKGSTMANLSAGALQGVSVPLPPRELQNRFATFADEVGEQIDTLDEQSRKLRTARDLLLPRLMRGELTV